ncbi:MAG: YicC/YloC family endoribonuclease [Desulfobacterales bacterium]
MIKSMTGYAVSDVERDGISVSIEIRSYNSRHLDPVVRLPYGYTVLEQHIKAIVPEHITRGRVEIAVRIKDESEEAFRFDVNGVKAKAYYKALCALNEELGMDERPSLDMVLKAGDILVPAEVGDLIMEKTWPAVEVCLRDAFEKHNHAREKEGEFMYRDFDGRLAVLTDVIDRIEESTGGLLTAYQERLKNRIAALTGGMVEIDPARISQEAAFLADKSDISEEITRAKSHVNQFKSLMDSDEPAGRNLNFLLQEVNREFNTMGSKAQSADIAHMVVVVKTELEKIREQVQNIE